MKTSGTRAQLISTGMTDVLLLAAATLTGILTARLLGPAGRGELAVVILWPSMLAAIGSLGVREALVFYQARHTHHAARLTGAAILLAVIQSLALMAIGYILIPWLTKSQSPDVTRLGQIFLLSIPLNLLGWYFTGLLQGNLDILLYNAVRLSVNFIYLILLVFLWLTDAATLDTIAMGLLLANLCTACLALLLGILKFGAAWAVDLGLFRDVLHYGVRNHVGGLAGLINQRADQMLMAIFLSPQELGWYSVAVNVSGLTRIASGAFATLSFPKMASADHEGQRRTLSRMSRFNTTATLLVGLVLMLAIPLLIPLVYSADYTPSVLPAEILVVATVFLALGRTWSDGIRGMGHPLLPTYAEFWSLAVTAVGLYFFLPLLGIVGAAMVSLFAYFVSTAYLYLQLRRLLGLRLGELVRPVPLRWLLSAKYESPSKSG